MVGFDLGPLLQGQMRIAKLKMLITRLLLVLQVLVHCLYGGYNLHRFSDALGLVIYVYAMSIIAYMYQRSIITYLYDRSITTYLYKGSIIT